MQKSRFIIRPILVILVGVIGTSCGVSKDKYKGQVKENRKLKAALATALQSEKKQAEAYSTLKREADKLRARTDAAEALAKQSKQAAETLKKDFGARLKASEKEVEELAKARLEAEARAKQLKELTGQFSELIKKGQLSVKIVHGRMVIKLRSRVLFLSGSAKLLPYGVATVAQIARALKNIKGSHFQVAGHTDNQPVRRSKYADNWELSTARALAVVKVLTKQGVPPEYLSAAGFGEHQPVARNTAGWGRQMNRRIEITVLPHISRQLLQGPPRRPR